MLPEQRIELLENLISKARNLLSNQPISSDDKKKWKIYARNMLEKMLGENSDKVKTALNEGGFYAMALGERDEYYENERAKDIQSIISNLEGYIDIAKSEKELKLDPIEVNNDNISKTKVFIVHGHDESFIDKTARLLDKIEIGCTILKEEPNRGRTIIEKFEECSDEIGFALVLLTADDFGGAKRNNANNISSRARQNVIFELGYFIGKLGRSKVCVLYSEGVEMPSDIYGILYVKLDNNEAWKFTVAKELKDAGYEIDMNKL